MNVARCAQCGVARGTDTAGDGWLHEPRASLPGTTTSLALCFRHRRLVPQFIAPPSPGQLPLPGL